MTYVKKTDRDIFELDIIHNPKLSSHKKKKHIVLAKNESAAKQYKQLNKWHLRLLRKTAKVLKELKKLMFYSRSNGNKNNIQKKTLNI
jgi:hypothetical protein